MTVAVWAQPRRLGVLGLTTLVNGRKNSPRLTPNAAKMVASASTVTPLSPLLQPARISTAAYAAEEVVGLCTWRDRDTFIARGDWRAMSLAGHALIPLGRPKPE